MTEVEVRVTKATVAIHVMQALPHHLLLLEKPLVGDQKVQVALRKRETARPESRAGVCLSAQLPGESTFPGFGPQHTPLSQAEKESTPKGQETQMGQETQKGQETQRQFTVSQGAAKRIRVLTGA